MKKYDLFKKVTTWTLVGVLGASALTACHSGDDGSSSTGQNSSAETGSDEVQTIVVGVISTTDKWGNLDENGELDGYEIAVLKEVDKRLPQYEFDIQPSDFNNILLSLDTGKIDLGSHMYEYNEDRAAQYLYSNEGYINFSTYFILPADSELDGSWESLAGHVVGEIGETDNSSLIVKAYNEENPEKAIDLDYYGSVSDEVIVQSLLDARWDAIISVGSWTIDTWNKDYGNGESIVKLGDTVSTSLAYYLYPKDGQHEELRDAVDGVLKELKEDGTLKEISETYFGYDITPKE